MAATGFLRWMRLGASQAELTQVFERGHADVPVKVMGEGALVAEAQFLRHLGDLGSFLLQCLAGGLDAKFHDEGLRTRPKGLDELTVQLSG